jgi:hypothetical protein
VCQLPIERARRAELDERRPATGNAELLSMILLVFGGRGGCISE